MTDEKKPKQRQVSISASAYTRLKAHSIETTTHMSTIIDKLINEYLEQQVKAS